MGQETKCRTPRRMRFVLQVSIHRIPPCSPLLFALHGDKDRDRNRVCLNHSVRTLQWGWASAHAQAPSPSCNLPGVCRLHPYFHRGKHREKQWFFHFWEQTQSKPDESSPVNLHSETEVKSALPGNRPTGKVDPELLTPPQCTQGLVRLSVAICVIKAGPWAPYIQMHRLP